MNKICKECGETKGVEEFRVYQKGYISGKCKDCLNKRIRFLASQPARRDRRLESQRRANRKLKNEVMDHYGGKCECCGETDDRFLTIDHLVGSGRKDREVIKKGMVSGGSYYYRWIRDQGYPSHLRVLCFNCNSGRMVNGGVCPHKDGWKEVK